MSIEQYPLKPQLTAFLVLWLSAVTPTFAAAGKSAIVDPVGDTFGTGAPRIDVTSFSVANDGDELVIDLSFAGPISAPDSGRDDAVAGFVDLDIDRNPTTGGRPFVDFLTGLATGMGTELYIPLATYSEGDGRADLVDGAAGVVGRVAVVWGPSMMSIRIPRVLLGGDGVVHSAAVVGNLAEATDAVPDGGFVASDGLPLGEPVLLNGDRFRVELFWENFEGGTGTGKLAVRSEDSAVFYFFDPLNWEVMVKVLDACNFNGFYWVFAAATTNVEYTLTVTDLEAGVSKQYFNPLGTASPAITDTAAFATCP